MDEPKNNANPQKMFPLRMSEAHHQALKKESQRINVSVTALINFIINDYLEKFKIQKDGE
jgi:predicted HicB family RNase H-like nuclease